MTTLFIIIEAADRDAVRTAAEAAFGEQALKEFTVALSSNGAAPASHYCIAGQFDDEGVTKVNALALQFPTAHVETYDLKVQPNRPFQLLNELNLLPIQKPFP